MSASELDELKNILQYDPDSGQIIWRVFRGNGVKVGDEAGWFSEEGYRIIQVSRKNYKAHRLAWLFTYVKWPDVHLDHIDGNPSNNRIQNLRECTASENQQNQKMNKNSASGLIGVSFHRATGKWIAQITVKGDRHYMGKFESPEDASVAYLAAKARLHKFQPVPRNFEPKERKVDE